MAARPMQDTLQSMPETIEFRRYIPRRGPSGAVIFLTALGIMSYGWYWVGKSNAERRELNREKAWSRLSLVPLLQAETDRDLVRRLRSVKAKESEIMMSSHPSWSSLDLKTPIKGIGKLGVVDESQAEPVYHTERYIPPTFVFLPPDEGHTIAPQWWRGTKMFMKNPPYHDRADWKGKKDPINEA
ncbi:hypothetical protein HDU76_012844 [Blyttiomyces sp. JEL0837]|nr:hypothetical protein HDU76_012844 [Blyttiomyces sp. JEL0837]